MDSTLATSSTFLTSHKPKTLTFPLNPFPLSSKNPRKPSPRISICAKFSSNPNINPSIGPNQQYPFTKTLKNVGGTLVLSIAATLMAARFSEMPAKAEPLAQPSVETEPIPVEEGKVDDLSGNAGGSEEKSSPLSSLLESNVEFVSNLKELLQKKMEVGEDDEALEILGKLVEAQPDQTEWKFLRARLLSEMGKTQEAREAFEAILASNPLSFEALFENALLMDRCGERDAVIGRLEEALRIAEDEEKGKEARDVKLIIAQIQFLHKNVDEALQSYDELAREDPNDFRPYFCKGMIYSLLDRNDEAREQFAKYRELSPKKFEVEGYLRSPLSRMKLFGTDS